MEKISAYFTINFGKDFMDSLQKLIDSVDGYNVVIRNVWNDGSHDPEVELEASSDEMKKWYEKMIAHGLISDEEWEEWKDANL